MAGNITQGSAPTNPGPIMYSPFALPDPLRYTYIAYLVVIIIIGVPGNILIALVYGRTKTKNTCDWFILFMSVTDCTVCLLSPLLHLRYELQIDMPWMTGPMCGLEHWLQLTAMLSSCHYLTAIALDRYVKICNSRLPTLTPKVAPYACVGSFLSSAAICLYPSIDSFQNDICGLFDPRGFETSRKVYFTLIFCGFAVCFILVSFAYWNVCQQIFIKVKNKQRLLEHNGLHDVPKTEKAEESGNPDQYDLRVNPSNCLSLRLKCITCVRAVSCCRRQELGSNGKTPMPHECSEERHDVEHVPLTSTNYLKHSDMSLNSDKAFTTDKMSVALLAEVNSIGDNHRYMQEIENSTRRCEGDTQPIVCKNHHDFQLEKEDDNTTGLQTVSLKSDEKNSCGVGDTKMTLLSLTTASWPSTEEEPTPSADIPVSFYLENLISQAQGVYVTETKDLEYNSGLKDNKNVSFKKSFEENEVSDNDNSNVYVNRISFLGEAEKHRLLHKRNIRHALLKCSVSAGGIGPVKTSVLTGTRSQPLLSNLEVDTLTTSDGSDNSKLEVLYPNKPTADQRWVNGNGIGKEESTRTPRLTKSLSVDNLWGTKSLLRKRLNTKQVTGHIKRKTLTQPSQLGELRDFSDSASCRSKDHRANEETCQNVALEEDQQPKAYETFNFGRLNPPSTTAVAVHPETVSVTPSIIPKNDIASQHSHILTENSTPQPGTSPCHIATPTRPFEDSSSKKLLGSLGENLEVPTRRHHASLRNMASTGSVDSETCLDEIEEDMPTGSFMQKWRSQVRRKAKSRQRKGLTSSGKSMSSCTGKRFARERQITFMLISVTLTFLLASAPSWIVWVAVLWEPSVMSKGLWSRLIFVATVGVYLLNFISSYFIFYAFNPSFRSKCRDLLTCCRGVKAGYEGDSEVAVDV